MIGAFIPGHQNACKRFLFQMTPESTTINTTFLRHPGLDSNAGGPGIKEALRRALPVP